MSLVRELPKLTLRLPVPVRRQLTDCVREMIRSGQLSEGIRLPSSQELARHWGTDPMTVHRALAPLVREGLLERNPGIGTFVRRPSKRLRQVAIYLNEELDTPSAPAYERVLVHELRRLMRDEGIEPDVWVEPRSRAEARKPWPALVRAAEQRRLQAVIVPVTTWAQIEWISRLPVPSSFFGTAQIPNAVDIDMVEFARLSLLTLSESGYTSAGLITHANPRSVEREGRIHAHMRMFQAFERLASGMGIEMRGQWIVSGNGSMDTSPSAFERFGYERCKRIWAKSKRPRALIVTDDVIAQGVIKALLELGVRVPRDVALVLRKNARLDMFCPYPARYIVTDEAEVAQALIEQVQRQYRGEPIEKIYIAPHLKPSEQ